MPSYTIENHSTQTLSRNDGFCSGFEPDTLVDVLNYRSQHQEDELSITFLNDGDSEETQLTYRQLDHKAKIIAGTLQAHVSKGARALILYPPGLDYLIAFWGCLYAGVIAVPAYPPRRNRNFSRLQAIVTDAQVTIGLTHSGLLEDIQNHFISESTDMKWLCIDTDKEDDSAFCAQVLKRDDLAFLQYTSGSTSTPKGVMISHAHILHNLMRIRQNFEHTSHSRGVIWLPPYHDMGLIGGILQPLYAGFPVTLFSPFAYIQRPKRWLAAITKYRATTSGGPNFSYDLCVRSISPDERDMFDLSCWELAFTGGEPVRKDTLERFAEYFAPCGFKKEAFYPCYGMAEATLMISGGKKNRIPKVKKVSAFALQKNQWIDETTEDKAYSIVSCGLVQEDQQILIVNPETKKRCLDNEVGEVWVSDPSVAQGYWNQSDISEETFSAYLFEGDGPFLRTGDMGFLDENELFITGRCKDLIIIKGRNFYPQDIEAVVGESHSMLQPIGGAAFSVDVANEEQLVVVQEVVRSHRNLDQEEVISSIRQALASKLELQAHAIVLLKPFTLPKTTSGKVQRFVCRDGFLNGTLKTLFQ